MAWIFSMWIETETEQERLAAKQYFGGYQITTESGIYTLVTYPNGIITAEGLSQTGIRSQEDADTFSAIGFALYSLLRSSPLSYRYALTGVEADEWRTMQELEQAPEDLLLMPGFVIRNDIYKHLGSPGNLEPFNTHYCWIPYQGEHLPSF